MATIRIPENVFPGFKVITSLKENQINQIVTYLNSMPVGKKYDEVADDFDGILGENSGNELFKTILSFSELVDEDEENHQDVVNNLVGSFIDLSKNTLDSTKKERLKINLLKIFNNYEVIDKTVKTKQLSYNNENNLSDFKLLTDIRIVFDNDIKNKERIGIVIHKLNIEYNKNNNEKEIHLALDINDLKKLKSKIDNAIEKDQIIREDYKEVLKYII